jgi:uncharacterized protein (DUF1330 family)
MSAYMIIEVEVLDQETYGEYMERIPATVAQYGGRYVIRSSQVAPLTGDWRPERLIVVEFPSMEQMMRWNATPEYQALAPLRVQSTRTRAIAVEGYAG